MTSLSVILDTEITPSTPKISQEFTNADFLLIHIITPLLAENEGLEIGLALLMKVNTLNGVLTKYVPFKISEYTIGLIGDSKELIAIPREFSETNYPLQVAIGVSENVKLRVYAILSNTTKEAIQSTCDDILDKLKIVELKQNANLVLDTAQNAGLAIVATGLVPITAGVTSGAIPIFTGASTVPLLPSV